MTDHDIVTRLRRCGCCDSYEAAVYIEGLRIERDEARHGESVAIATLQGVIEERTTLRAERDEARRLYCVLRDGEDGLTCKEWAERKGWDCFKEEQ